MLTINTNWKAAFSQPGVAPIVHVRILDLAKFTLSSAIYSSGTTTISVPTTATLIEGMTVTGTGIPAGAYITGINYPLTGSTSTTFEISESTTGIGSSVTLTFGKVYQMATQGFNRRYHSDRFNADPIILNVVPVSVSMDKLDREPQVGEVNIEIADDGTFRRLMGSLSLPMKRKKVEVRVGSAHLALSDFEKVFVGELFEISPSDGILNLKLRDAWQGVTDVMTRRGWINVHPLQAVKQAIIDSGALVEADIDEDSFDPDHSSKADIGHYCVSAYKSYWPGRDNASASMAEFESDMFQGAPSDAFGVHSVPLKPIVSELVRGMYGFIFMGPDGKLKFRHYDETDSVVRHFATSDYSDFQQDSTVGDVINDVKIKIGYYESEHEFRLKNATSVLEYGAYEKDLGARPYSATSTYAYLTTNDTALTTSDTSVVVFAGQTSGLSGTRGFASGASLGANAGVSVVRPLILLNQKELIKCTAVAEANGTTIPNREIWRAQYDDPYGSATSYEVAPDIAQISSLTRGFGSTTAHAIELDDAAFASNRSWEHARNMGDTPQWWREPLWDITMLYDYALKILKRYQHGLPTIQFTAPLSHFDLELGDFITIDASEFLHRNIDGLDSGTKWEIVGKDASFFGDDVGIKFSCALVNETAVSTAPLIPLLPPMKVMQPYLTFGDNQIENVVTGNSVRSGLIASISSASGKLDLTDGSCNSGGTCLTFNGFTSPILPASKDCYIGISASGMPVVSTVANLGLPPSIGPNEVRICKAVTGGSSVVSAVTDLRSLGGSTPKNFDFDSGIHNLNLPNAGFSAWTLGPTHAPDGWHLMDTTGEFQTHFTQATGSRSGQFSLMSLGGTNDAAGITSNLIPLEPGTPYIMSAWLKGVATDTFDFGVQLFDDRGSVAAASAAYGKSGDVALGVTTYKKFSFEFTTGADTKYGRSYFTRAAGGGGINGAHIHIDSIAVEKAPDRFRAKADSNQDLDAGTLYLIEFGEEVTNNAGTYSTSTNKFTARVPGLYSFAVSVPFAPDTGTGTLAVGFVGLWHGLLGGGGSYMKKGRIPEVVGTDQPRHVHFSVFAEFLDAGDTVSCYAYASGSSTTHWDIEGGTFADSCWFEGWKID